MIYYCLLAIADALFSFQFLFNKKFEESCGSSLASTLTFSLYSSICGFVMLFALNGFRLSFSLFSFIMAAINAAVGILYSVASLKAFESVNLSAYSFFAMLGGMLLPFFYGILFCNEAVTFTKLLCCAVIALSMVLTIDSDQKSHRKIYYLAVFVLNGLSGVISTIHQTNANAVPSNDYLMLSRIITVFVCLPYFLKNSKDFRMSNAKSILYSCAFAAFSGIGNLLTLISLKHIPASVQYPIITGGVMAISTLIGFARKEKINVKNVVALIIATGATVLMAFN